jgi:hypothetical protein
MKEMQYSLMLCVQSNRPRDCKRRRALDEEVKKTITRFAAPAFAASHSHNLSASRQTRSHMLGQTVFRGAISCIKPEAVSQKCRDAGMTSERRRSLWNIDRWFSGSGIKLRGVLFQYRPITP